MKNWILSWITRESPLQSINDIVDEALAMLSANTFFNNKFEKYNEFSGSVPKDDIGNPLRQNYMYTRENNAQQYSLFYDIILPKNANDFIEYQKTQPMVNKNPLHDRIHPLDTVNIVEFKTEHKRDIGKVFVHSGGYADEIARSYNALAITLADHIYFRSNAYNPYSEEGRKLLAHELTHVAQHKEGLIHPNITKDALEVDAEMGEKRAEYEDDPVVTIEVDGEYFSFRESKMSEYASMVADNLRRWIIEQKTVLSEEKYLKLLCNYEQWIQKNKQY